MAITASLPVLGAGWVPEFAIACIKILRRAFGVNRVTMRRLVLTIGLIMALAVVGSGAGMAASLAQRETNGIVAFATDWGTRDFYVGAAKGVAYSIFPEVRMVDISHDIEPYNIGEGAITLLLAAREYPSGTVFVAVVDPGVGTERRPIALKTDDGKFFVGPDNGLFTMVMQEFGVAEVREITNKAFMRPGPTSFSFHGRDIFTPTAANLAAGRKFEEVGAVVEDAILLDISPARAEGNKAYGQVIMVDQYGNLQANISRSAVEELGLAFGDSVCITVGSIAAESKFVNTYGDVPEGDDLVFIASTEFLEISINMGDAKSKFDANIGSPVVVEMLR